MLPIKSEFKSIKVSYVETKKFTIKIPSFKIPTHYIKGVGILVGFYLIYYTLSFNPPSITQMEESCLIGTGMIRVMPLPMKDDPIPMIPEIPEEVEDQGTEKIISITDIIPNTKSNKKVLDFICTNEVLKRAFNVQSSTGLYVATVIGQKGVESAWNNSSLCNKTRNYGNIKCFQRHNHVKAGCIRAWDKREKSNDWYVKVNSNWQGWSIYKNLIYSRYMKAANQKEIRDQLTWLKKKGWATDKNYDKKIWKVINQYNLIKLQEYIDAGYTITSDTGKYILLEQ